MKKTWKKAVCLLIIGVLTAQGPLMSVKADVVDGDNSIGGFTELLDKYYSSIKSEEEADTTELFNQQLHSRTQPDKGLRLYIDKDWRQHTVC